MKISDILLKESNNSGQIVLHREGLFWRAYEQSAYLFSINVRQYHVIRKHFKNIAMDIVYLGFPHSVKQDVLKSINSQDIQSDEKQIIITGYQIDEAGFQEWKNSITIPEPEWKDCSSVAEPNTQYSGKKPANPEQPLLEKILRFPVAAKTPIECQQFIIEIQNQINGSI